jgi:ribosomal subunit interface protein
VDVRVAGHQVEVGDALRGHAEDRMRDIADKYFSRAIGANVTLGAGPQNDFTCDIVAPIAQGIVLKASNRAGDARLAFEGAADRIEKQLRRYARRLRDHKADGAGTYVADAAYTVFAPPEEEEAEPAASPPIVAETRVDIPDASVGDAVMIMDLRHTNALMFRNSGTGDYNMVYRREDGTIGWVEPKPA